MASRLVTSATKMTLRDIVPGAQPGTTLTLSSGAATPTVGQHVIAAEAGAADDFDTVTLTNLRALDSVDFTVDTGDTITFTNGVGNITTDTGSSIVATAGQTVRVKVNAAGTGVVASLVGSAVADAFLFKGVIDCSANPDYPAADAGHTYRVSVAGKIGGASGPNVEISDLLTCTADGTASGDHATVGSSWTITQANLDGAVIGPASATSGNLPSYDGTTGKLLNDSGFKASGAFIDGGTVAADGNNEITVAPRRRYQLTASDSIAGVIGLADGEFAQIIAPSSGSTTLEDAGTTTAGQALELSGSNLAIASADETVYTIYRVGSAIRVSRGGAASVTYDGAKTVIRAGSHLPIRMRNNDAPTDAKEWEFYFPNASGNWQTIVLSDDPAIDGALDKQQRQVIVEIPRGDKVTYLFDYCHPDDVAVSKLNQTTREDPTPDQAGTLKGGAGTGGGYMSVEMYVNSSFQNALANGGEIVGVSGDPTETINVGGTVYGAPGANGSAGPATVNTIPGTWVQHNTKGNFERSMGNRHSNRRMIEDYKINTNVLMVREQTTNGGTRGGAYGVVKIETLDHNPGGVEADNEYYDTMGAVGDVVNGSFHVYSRWNTATGAPIYFYTQRVIRAFVEADGSFVVGPRTKSDETLVSGDRVFTVYSETSSLPVRIHTDVSVAEIEFQNSSSSGANARIGSSGAHVVVKTGASATERFRVNSAGIVSTAAGTQLGIGLGTTAPTRDAHFLSDDQITTRFETSQATCQIELKDSVNAASPMRIASAGDEFRVIANGSTLLSADSGGLDVNGSTVALGDNVTMVAQALDLPSIAASSFSTVTATVTGATTSQAVANVSGQFTGLILAWCRVSAADTVQMSFYNPHPTDPVDLANATVRYVLIG